MKKIINIHILCNLLPLELWIQVDEFTDLMAHTTLRASCSFMRAWLPHRKLLKFENYKRLWEADQNRSKIEFQEAYKLCTRALTQDHYDYLCKNFINEEVMRICTQALSTPNAFTQIDLSAQSNYAIILASERGHLSIVELLLQDARVDPSAKNNAAIRFASQNGHLLVVQMLLQDYRVDPAAYHNYAICFASQNGHFDVVEFLINNSRVYPAADNNYAIRWASENGHSSVVELDYRVNPNASDNACVT